MKKALEADKKEPSFSGMARKKCVICERRFVPMNSRQKTCLDRQCQQEHRRRSSMACYYKRKENDLALKKADSQMKKEINEAIRANEMAEQSAPKVANPDTKVIRKQSVKKGSIVEGAPKVEQAHTSAKGKFQLNFGEWYDLSEDQARKVLDFAAKMIKGEDPLKAEWPMDRRWVALKGFLRSHPGLIQTRTCLTRALCCLWQPLKSSCKSNRKGLRHSPRALT